MYQGPSGIGKEAYQQDLKRIQGFTNDFLESVWESINWCWNHPTIEDCLPSVDEDWADLIRSEMSKRGLNTNKIYAFKTENSSVGA